MWNGIATYIQRKEDGMNAAKELDNIRVKIWLTYSLLGVFLSVGATILLDDVLDIFSDQFLSAEGVTCGCLVMTMGLALKKFSTVLQEDDSQ